MAAIGYNATTVTTGSPIEAARANINESTLNTLADERDAREALGNGGPVYYCGPGVTDLRSFAGADSDAKLTAALSYAAAQTYIPAIIMPDGVTTFNQGGRAPFTGMKIYGPGADGAKGMELSSGKNSNHKIILNVGSGASSWFNGTATCYYINARNLAFQMGTNAQFWNQATGSLYACQFHSLDFLGATGVFGNATTKALMTQTYFTGHWATHGHAAGSVQYHIGGSDNSLWADGGYININSPTTGGGGQPQIWLDYCQKTRLGATYITAEGDWGGLKLSGSANSSGNTWMLMASEGRSVTVVSTRPTVEIEGGQWAVWGGWFGQVDPTELGTITQSGGNVTFYSPTYNRSDAAAATQPFLYQTGGTAQIRDAKCARSGEQLRVRWSSGTVETAPLPANSIS